MYQSTNSLDNINVTGEEAVTDKIRCETTRVNLNHHHLNLNIILGFMNTAALYPAGTAPVKTEFVPFVVTLLLRPLTIRTTPY